MESIMPNNYSDIIAYMTKQNARTLIEGLSVECDDDDLIDEVIGDDGQILPIDKVYTVVMENPTVLRFKFGRCLIPNEKVKNSLKILER